MQGFPTLYSILLGLAITRIQDTIGEFTQQHQSKVNLVSFNSENEDLAFGLHYLLPFVRIPIVRREDVGVYSNEPALFQINPDALITSGILSIMTAAVSYLVKLFTPYGGLDFFRNKPQRIRRLDPDTDGLNDIFNHLKVIYRNSSTDKPKEFSVLDIFKQGKHLNLTECLVSASCMFIQRSRNIVREDYSQATALDKIIDGLVGLKWLHEMLQDYSPQLYAIIGAEAMRMSDDVACRPLTSYGKHCNWSTIQQNLILILSNYMNVN